MNIIPAIDILDGKCVRLLKGNYSDITVYNENPIEQVKRLALLTKEAGLDGVVCSSHEIEIIREACGDDFITMVPGIRPAGSTTGDQKRVMTPCEAVEKGASHLVIGRPITQADNMKNAAKEIIASL